MYSLKRSAWILGSGNCEVISSVDMYRLEEICFLYWEVGTTVKPVLSGHSKIDKTKILKTNGSLMKVKSIAECSLGAFCNIFGLH